MFNRSFALLGSILAYGIGAHSYGLEARTDVDSEIIIFGGGERPRPSRRGGQVAHRRWKRTRAAGITKRARR